MFDNLLWKIWMLDDFVLLQVEFVFIVELEEIIIEEVEFSFEQ